MNIISPFEATKISRTKPGDLIRIVHSMEPLGLVIHEEEDRRVIGVLQDKRGALPYHIIYERDFPCFRYTSGWVLELPRDSAKFDGKFVSASGAVHVGANGPLMNFGTSNLRHNELTVNLNKFEWDDVRSSDAAFPDWKIWAGESDIRQPDAKPIIHFTGLRA